MLLTQCGTPYDSAELLTLGMLHSLCHGQQNPYELQAYVWRVGGISCYQSTDWIDATLFPHPHFHTKTNTNKLAKTWLSKGPLLSFHKERRPWHEMTFTSKGRVTGWSLSAKLGKSTFIQMLRYSRKGIPAKPPKSDVKSVISVCNSANAVRQSKYDFQLSIKWCWKHSGTLK